MSLNAASFVRAKVNHSSLRPHRFQTRASDANGARCKTQARAQTGKKCFKKKLNCVSVYVTLCLLHTTKLGACVEFNGSLFMSEQNSAPQPISSKSKCALVCLMLYVFIRVSLSEPQISRTVLWNGDIFYYSLLLS